LHYSLEGDEAMDEPTKLGFIGLYLLLLSSFVYNLYIGTRTYRLLEDIGGVIALMATPQQSDKMEKEIKRENTMKRLLQEGIELERSM